MNRLNLLLVILKKFFTNKVNLAIVIFAIVVVGGIFFAYQKIIANNSSQSGTVGPEIDLTFDPEGTYALIYPRRDGNAMVLDLERTSLYNSISYELSYISDGIDRGVVGTINTNSKNSSYDQEILFGTCSKNICKYDPDVKDGTLVLHIVKDNKAYRMLTSWHIQNPQLDKGVLTSADGHFIYKINSSSSKLGLVGSSMVNDLTGAPKLPFGKKVEGKVYAADAPQTTILPKGDVSIELANKPPSSAQIYHYDLDKGDWEHLSTTITNDTLSASSPSGGVFAVLINQ